MDYHNLAMQDLTTQATTQYQAGSFAGMVTALVARRMRQTEYSLDAIRKTKLVDTIMNRTRSILVLLSALAVTLGCVPSAPTLKPDTMTTSETGILAVSVTKEDKPRGWLTNKNTEAWFYFRKIGTKDEIRLKSHEFSLLSQANEFEGYSQRSGRLLVVPLDPGSYEIFNWVLYVPGGSGYKYIYPKDPSPVRFEVAIGRITYLGNLNLKVLYGENFLGIEIEGGAELSADNESARDIELLHQRHPALTEWPVDILVPDLAPLNSRRDR